MEGILYYRKKHFWGYSNKALEVLTNTNIITSVLLGLKDTAVKKDGKEYDLKKLSRYVDLFKQKKIYLVVEGKTFLVKDE